MGQHAVQPARSDGCRPPAGVAWVIGANHKTGTFLNIGLATHISQQYLSCDPAPLAECVTAGAAGRTSNVPLIMDGHVHIANRTAWESLRREALSRTGRSLRAVHWVRDPLELTLSGYLYHKATVPRIMVQRRAVAGGGGDHEGVQR